jgi:hypothetical protein
MSVNALLPRWVTASVTEHIRSTVVDDLGLTFFVEGVDLESPEWFQTDSLVLRVTGPTVAQGSGQTIYRFEVMTMLTDLVSGGSNGFLNHDRLGTIANVLSGPIPVLNYGTGLVQVGCLDVDSRAKDFLRIVHFGKLDTHSEVVQGAVIVSYEICL